MLNSFRWRTCLAAMFLIHLSLLQSQNVPLSQFEGYYLKQGTYPNDATNWWMYNGLEVQGVTHDDDNWYFALTSKGKDNGILRRIPRSVALGPGSVPPSNPGIKTVTMKDVPQLGAKNFWHWGDPDLYTYKGVDYLLVPIPGPVIACFRADDLTYVNFADLSAAQQDYAGWCAVGRDGDLYSSSNHAWSIVRYDVDWEVLTHSNAHNAMTYAASYALKDGGGTPMQLLHMQGGEFTPSGELLYVVSGSAGCLGIGPGQPEPSDGIHVFETVQWREIQKSTKANGGGDFFSYTFENNCTCAATGSQSPEGLTIWDLDDGSAPNIGGQLHVLVDHYNAGFCDDAVTMQHFSDHVFVDENATSGPGLLGRRDHPFKTFPDAINYYPIWGGAHIVLRPGDYPTGGITLNKRLLITAEGGAATIK